MFNFCYFIRYLINEIIILKAVLMQIDPLHFLFLFLLLFLQLGIRAIAEAWSLMS